MLRRKGRIGKQIERERGRRKDNKPPLMRAESGVFLSLFCYCEVHNKAKDTFM